MEKGDYSGIGHDKWVGGIYGETVAEAPEHVVERIDAAALSLMILLDKAGIEYLYTKLSGVCHVIQVDSCICDVHGVPGRYGELCSVALDVREPYCMTMISWWGDDGKFGEKEVKMIRRAVKLWKLHDAAAAAKENSLRLADAMNKRFEGKMVFAIEDDMVSCRMTGLNWEQGLRLASFVGELRENTGVRN